MRALTYPSHKRSSVSAPPQPAAAPLPATYRRLTTTAGPPTPPTPRGAGEPPPRVPTALGSTSVAYAVAPLNPQVWVLPYLA